MEQQRKYNRTRVLVVDDSAIVRRVLSQQLGEQPGIEVVGAASDPFVARDLIVKLEPDVVTLDVEMPRMDGISFLRRLMRYYPVPTIIVSSLTPESSEMALEALRCGAVDVICKPGVGYAVGRMVEQLGETVKGAAHARVERIIRTGGPERERRKALVSTTHKVLALGASTGGTVAIERILTRMPYNAPGTLITQHMPAAFTRSFAERVNRLSEMTVKQAETGDSVVPGVALIAPGDRHLLLRRSGARYVVEVKSGPRVSGHRPSVDVMLRSVALEAGRNAVGVVLTGMGADGAAGLAEMRLAGARTFAEHKDSCVVFGMPKAALECGAAQHAVLLDDMVPTLLDAALGASGVKYAAVG